MKWNKKKFFRNIFVLILVVIISLVSALGLLWGLEQEQKVNNQTVTSWINEK